MWKWNKRGMTGRIKGFRRRSRLELLKPVAGSRFIEVILRGGVKKGRLIFLIVAIRFPSALLITRNFFLNT
jgi:hypothetical protein